MVTLEKVNSKNVWKLLKLRVAPEQEDFVASNTESIVEAYTTVAAGGAALPFGVYADGDPVGFVMLGYDDLPDEENPSVSAGNYTVWRLMIDEKQQGKGYGKAALGLALDYIRSFPCGPAKLCWLSYEQENTAAAALYHAFGFSENGEYDGDEIVAVLSL